MQPGYGYQLHQRLISDFANTWHASQSQTYNILQRLETQGYLKSTNIEQTKLPARQQLQITETGRKRFTHWLMEPTPSSVHAIRVEFITRLYFLRLYYPAKIQGLINVQIDMVKASLQELVDDLKDLSDSQVFEQMALELRIQLLSSVIIWMEKCRETFTLEQPSGATSE